MGSAMCWGRVPRTTTETRTRPGAGSIISGMSFNPRRQAGDDFARDRPAARSRSPTGCRPPRRRGLQPGIDRQPVPSHRRPPGRGLWGSRSARFRAAARVPIRPPGQHDRNRRTPDARRRVPIYSLYSETREPTAEMLATSTCSSSICRTSAHGSTLRLHGGELHARRGAPRRARGHLRSAQPGRRRRGRRAICSIRRLRRSSGNSRFRSGTE